MTVGVGTIAERALRRLNVAVVAVADRPDATAVVTVQAIADAALQALGATVPAGQQPPLTAIVTMQDIADAALQALGVTVPAADQPALSVVIAVDTIATAALTELGVIAADETPATSDMTLARAKVNAVHDDMVAQGLVSWASTAIPQAVSEEYTKLTAAMAASSFGKTVDPAIVAMLEGRVRKYSQVNEAGDVALARVASVHDSLVAQANVSWTSAAIPQAMFDEYAALTTAQLAPIFGTAVDPATIPPIEMRIRKFAQVTQGRLAATQAVLSVHDGLVTQAFVTWASSAIPQALFDEYRQLTAIQLAPVFGVAVDPATAVPQEASVRRYQVVLDAPDAAQNAVMDIHNDLSMRGMARWSVFDIPDSAADAYEQLAAYQLAPLFIGLFDVKLDPNTVPRAERQLARMIALPTSGEPVQAAYF